MISNYFKIAWRNIFRNRVYSLVNVAGLFTAILFVMLIGAFVWQENQVNKHLRHAGQQYFLQSEFRGQTANTAVTSVGPLAKRLREEYPGLVANYYRWDGITSGVSHGETVAREGIQLGDSTLLSMYGFDLLHGDPATALKEPFSVVIRDRTAKKYFGRTDVVGQPLTIQSFSGSRKDFIITGVLKPVRDNSVTHLNADNDNSLFIPANTHAYFGRTVMDDWTNTWTLSYIELQPGVRPEQVNRAIAELMQRNAPDGIRANVSVHVVPLTDYYLDRNNGLVRRMLSVLSLVGLFILLMAVVNFVNITIGSSGNRIREIGVRKVMGSMRSQLVFQFLAESILLVTGATALALVVYPWGQQVFSGIMGREVPALEALPGYFLLIPVLLVLVVGFLAGIYPAFVLSALKTADSLKGKLKTVKEKVWLRKSLVSFQFAIAVIVLVAAAIVTQQVNYFFSRGIGYNKEYVLSSQVPRDWSRTGIQKMRMIRDDFARMPEVTHVSLSYEIPNGNNGNSAPMYRLGTDSVSAVPLEGIATDENYLDTYGIPLKAGRFFDSRGLDSGHVILNEKAVAMLGYPAAADAVGSQLRIPGDPTVFTVKGVVKDFHFFSMQQAMAPIVFFDVNSTVAHRYLSFKLRPGNVAAAISALQRRWSQLMPGSPFEYSFMDSYLEKMYATELQLKKACYAATFMALVIALLGVTGLVSLSIRKRVREIGMRKVLGASPFSISGLFLKEFVSVIIAAAVVACPVAYLVMKQWLNDYAYRVPISLQPFLLSIGAVAFVTGALIMSQTIRAALMNPVRALRTE